MAGKSFQTLADWSGRIEQLRHSGSRIRPGDWVLLGLVTQSGQGLSTADDKRFTAAIAGTPAGETNQRAQERLEQLVLASDYKAEYEAAMQVSTSRERALLTLWTAHGGKRPSPLKWPKTLNFRVVTERQVRHESLTPDERKHGIDEGPFWVPFEKGDSSQESNVDSSSRMAAAWRRDNGIVIDWSREAVTLLRTRAETNKAQTPYFRNEHLWFESAVSWNKIGSYFRARLVPENSIFSDGAFLIRPFSWISWLSPLSLLALMNASVTDFTLRTFLTSRMNQEVGQVRRMIVPVLSVTQKDDLERLAIEAVIAKEALDSGGDSETLTIAEAAVSRYVNDLYGIQRDADLWVVR